MILARFERFCYLFSYVTSRMCASLRAFARFVADCIYIKRDAPCSTPPALWAPAEGSLLEEGFGADASAPRYISCKDIGCPGHLSPLWGGVRGGRHSVST